MGEIQFQLTLVRHGQTESNLTFVVCGQANDPLTAEGQDQARKAGAALADQHFDLVYSSPLERTMDTARAVVDQNKSLEKDFPIQVDDLLMERSFGKFEKVPMIDHVKAAMKVGYKTAEEFWNDFTPETSETMEEVLQRSQQFFSKLIEDVSSKKKRGLSVLVAGHGIWIQEFLTYLSRTGKLMDVPSEKELRVTASPNTGITKLLVHCDTDGNLSGGQCTQMYKADHINKAPYNLAMMFEVVRKKYGV